MKAITYAKPTFEAVCGDNVRFDRVLDQGGTLNFSFTLTKTGVQHTIGTEPTGTGRAAIEQAAKSAGQWAKVMSERVMGGSNQGLPQRDRLTVPGNATA